MTNYDPRLELARKIAQGKRTNTPISLTPTVQNRSGLAPDTQKLSNRVSDAALTISQRYPNLKQEVSNITSRSSAPKGPLAGIIGSPPVKLAFEALSVIDIGRRTLLSGVREATDFLDTDPDNKASFNDFFEQVKNKQFGFGTAFPMKGNWGRFTGLVGDIALDPTTYLTLGTKQAATFGQRLAMAPMLLEKGLPAATVSKFLSHGKSALGAEQILEAGLKRSGVYMFGSKVRIPMTGAIGEGLLSGITKGRLGFTNTKIGETLQRGFMGMGKAQSTVVRDLRLALATGREIPENILKDINTASGMGARETAIRFLGANTARESAQGVANVEFSTLVAQKFNAIGQENMAQYGDTVHEVITGVRPAVNASEQSVADELKAIYQQIWDTVDRSAKDLDPESSTGHVAEYFPWVMTDDAKKHMADLTKPWVASLRTIMEPNPLDPMGSFKSRTLKEGVEFFWTMENGVKVPYKLKAEDLNITRINEISRGAIGMDFFKTNAADVLGGHYVQSASNQMGALAMYADLDKSGVVRRTLRNVGPSDEMTAAHAANIDSMVKHTATAAADAETAMAAAVKAINDHMQEALPAAKKTIKELEKDAQKAAKNVAAVLYPGAAVPKGVPTRGAVDEALAKLAAATDNLVKLQNLRAGLFDEETPKLFAVMQETTGRQINTLNDLQQTIVELTAESDAISRRAKTLPASKGKLTKAEKQASDELYSAQLKLESKKLELNDRMAEAMNELAETTLAHEQFMELGNLLNVRFEDILDGKNPRGLEIKRVKGIVEGKTKLSYEGTDMPRYVEDFAADPGAVNLWIDNNIQETEFFKRILEQLPASIFNKTAIKTMSYDKVLEIVAKGANGVDNAYDSIMAATFLMARNKKFYGAIVPDAVLAAEQKLLTQIDEVAAVVGFIQKANDGDVAARSFMKSKAKVEAYSPKIRQMETALSVRENFRAWKNEAERRLASGDLVPDDEASEIFFDGMDEEFVDLALATIGDGSENIANGIRAMDNFMEQANNQKWVIEDQEFGVEDLEKLLKIEATEQANLQKLADKLSVNPNYGFTKLAPTNRDVSLMIRSMNQENNGLADALSAYSMVSETERRFQVVGVELAGLGQIPSDSIHSDIVRIVARQHYDKIIQREQQVNLVASKMSEIRAQVETVLGKQNSGRGTFGVVDPQFDPVRVFDELLEEAYNDPIYGEAMETVMGSILKYVSDGKSLAAKYGEIKLTRNTNFVTQSNSFFEKYGKKLGIVVSDDTEPFQIFSLHIKPLLSDIDSNNFDFARLGIGKAEQTEITKLARGLIVLDREARNSLKDFSNKHLKPWFKEVYPYEKFKAKVAISRMRSTSPVSNEISMRAFFTDILGGRRRNEASTRAKVIGNLTTKGGKNAPLVKSPGEEMIVTMVAGTLQSEQRKLSARTSALANAFDPATKAEDFLKDPFGLDTGPFTYAASLESLANTLSEQVRRIKPSTGSLKPIIKAEKEAASAADKAAAAAARLGDTDPSPRRKFPNTPEKEIEIAKVIKKIRTKHDKLIGSQAYVLAKEDLEITKMLEQLSVVDGWKMRDLNTGESGWNFSSNKPVVKLKDFGLQQDFADRVRVWEDASELADNTPDLYMYDEATNRLVSIEQGGLALLDAEAKATAKSARELFKIDPQNPEIDVLNQQYNDFVTGKTWKKVRLNRVTLDQNIDVNKSFVVDVSDARTGVLSESGVRGEYAVRKLASERAEIASATTARYATFREPATAAQRKQIADYLIGNQAITPQMYDVLVSDLNVNDALKQTFRGADGQSVSLGDNIKNWEYETGVARRPDAPAIGDFQSDFVNQLSKSEQKLSFSEAEWESLFVTPFGPGEAARNASLTGSAKRNLDQLRSLAMSGQEYFTVTVGATKIRESVKSRIRELESEIIELGKERAARGSGVQSLALEKVRQLYRQFDSIKGNTNKTVNSFVADRGTDVAPQVVLDARKAGLNQNWESTQSYKKILEEQELANSADMIAFKQMRGGVNELSRAAKAARQVASDKRSNISYSEAELIHTSQQILDAGIASGNPQINEVLAQMFDIDLPNAAVEGSVVKPTITGLKLEGVSQKTPKEVRAIVKELREQFPERVTTFAPDVAREQGLISAIGNARFNAMETSYVVAEELRILQSGAQDAVDKLSSLRERLLTFTSQEAEVISRQAELLKQIQQAVDLNTKLRDDIERVWVTGYGKNAKGNISKAKNAKQVEGLIPAATRKYLEVQAKAVDLQGQFDSLLPRFQQANTALRDANIVLKPKIEEMRALIDQKKTWGKRNIRVADKTSTYKGKVKVSEANIDEYNSWLQQASEALDLASLDPSDPLNLVYAEVARTQTVYANAMLRQKNEDLVYDSVMKMFYGPKVWENFDAELNKGFASLEKIGLKGMEAPQEVLEMFENIRRLKDPIVNRAFTNFMGGYTGFFKRYATLSPGFHVRNAMSNTFGLLAAGGDVRNFPSGLRYYREMKDWLDKGKPLADWVASIKDPVERERVNIAARSMFAAGGGNIDDAFSLFLEKGSILKRLEDTSLTRASRKLGGVLENSARFMLGYDSAIKGLDFNMAAARTKRFLIDYEDIGQTDRAIKTIVPFWMWTSRALPMHLTNMWINPRPYAMYNSFKRNFTQEDENDLTPTWVKNVGGFKISGGMYLLPDLGFNRMGELQSQLSDPQQFLSMVNPVLRVPLELAANKQFFGNREFTGRPQDISKGGAVSALSPLLDLLGVTGTDSEGNKVANEKALYVLQSLLPTLGQAERLIPSGEKKSSNYLGYLGVPLRRETEGMRQSVLYEQLEQLNNLKTSRGL